MFYDLINVLICFHSSYQHSNLSNYEWNSFHAKLIDAWMPLTNYDVLLQEASSQKIQNITALNAIRITSAPGNTFSHKLNIYPVTFWCGVCAKQTLSPVYF